MRDDWGDTDTVEVGDPGRADPATRPGRPRAGRPVRVLGALVLLAVGFLGGALTHRQLAAVAPPPVGESTPLAGSLESIAPGLVAVRTPDGRVVGVRTSPTTRLVRAVGVRGTPPPGTPVEVRGVRDTDGALTATEVEVPAG